MKFLTSYRFWIGIGLLAAIITLRSMGIGNFITLHYLQQKRLIMQVFVDEHYLQAVLAYIGWYIGIVVLALPMAALTTIVGGFLFGILPATLYANIGAIIGATIFFLMIRHSLGHSLQAQYSAQLGWFNGQMEKYGTPYLITIRFIAVIPFFVANLLIGLTRVPLWQFIWTTSVGIIPGSLVYAFAGQQLTTIESLRDIISWNVIIAFALLAVLAMTPVIVQRFKLWGSNGI